MKRLVFKLLSRTYNEISQSNKFKDQLADWKIEHPYIACSIKERPLSIFGLEDKLVFHAFRAIVEFEKESDLSFFLLSWKEWMPEYQLEDIYE